MIIYHGSIFKVKTPEIIKSELCRDFGFGFYTTDIKEQAERWAIRKQKIESRKNISCKAFLNIYEFNIDKANEKLNVLNFTEPNEAWLDFIIKCRSDINFSHNYDIVTGKIANDNVGETVSFVMSGIMRKEDAITRLRFQKINNQICFNSEKSLEYLKFINAEEL
jgi:hypothetical protein